MRISKCRFVFSFGVVLMLTLGYQPAWGQDCNGNGIQDSLDLLPTPFGLPDTPDLVTIPSGLRPTSVIATARDLNGDWISLDVNEDGLVDMATTPSFQSFITVLINNGVDSDGVWLGARDYKDEGLPLVFANTPQEPWAITAGDLNLDGHTDLAVIYRSTKPGRSGFARRDFIRSADVGPSPTYPVFSDNATRRCGVSGVIT